MRGSAKKPPRCIRENAGVSTTPWESTHWATLPLCSHVATQLHIHPALSPSSSNSFPAWLPPVLIFLSLKSLFHGSPLASLFSSTQSPLSVSLTRPLLALPTPLLWFSSTLAKPFKGSFFSPLLPSLVPASPPAQALDPTAIGDQRWRAAGSHTHRCRPGSASGELQGEQRRVSGRTEHPTPCRAAWLPALWVLLGAPGSPVGLRGSLSISEQPQLREGRCAMRKSMEWAGASVLPGSPRSPAPPAAPKGEGLGALGAVQ